MSKATRGRPWAALIIAGGLAALAGVLLWDASGITRGGGYAGVGPADVPRLVAFGLLALSVATVVAGLRGEIPAPPPQRAAPVLWILLGLGLQLVLLNLVGFVIASALLFACTARAYGNRKMALGLGAGVLLAMAAYGVFDRLLSLNLPGGPLEHLIFGG